ncbi:hypothetical protein T439DRAFT_315326 [Meredithblackwellia eburnea MCA 4105]
MFRTATRSLTIATRVSPCTCLAAAPRPQIRLLCSSTPAHRIADDFVNIIQADAARPIPQVKSLSAEEGFTMSDGLIIPSPVIFINGALFMWDVPPPQEMGWPGWEVEKWKLFEVVTPRPDILLVGSGQRGLFAPPAFRKYINSLGIQVDVIDSKSACSTYNLLAEEGRRVAAAIYPLSPFDARTGKPWAR